MSFGSIEDLVRDLIERHLQTVSFKGLSALDDYLNKNLSFSLFADTSQRIRAIRLVECRNLIVHNRGVVNNIFKSRVNDASETIGDVIRFTAADMQRDIGFVASWIFGLDMRAVQKFGLDTSTRNFANTQS